MGNEENKYLRGFNHGYIMAKYLPDLLVKLVNDLSPTSEYLLGLFSGKKEYEIEKLHNHLNELSQLRKQSKDRKLDLGLE
jgi:hypothetical protein